MRLKKTNTFRVINRFYDHITKKANSTNLSLERNYTLHEIKFGAGNPSCYIVTNPHVKLPMGENEVCLKTADIDKLEMPTHKIVEKIAKEHGIGTMTSETDYNSRGETVKKNIRKDIEEVWDEILLLHKEGGKESLIFFEIDTPLYEADIFRMSMWENETFLKILNILMAEGMSVDNRILYAMRGLMLPITLGQNAKPEYFMPYNPHMIIFTNPKVGKSTMAERIGRRYDRARISRLFGFSTADSVCPGDLDARTESVIIDEVSEDKTDAMYSQILTFEENGLAKVAVGKETIICRGFSPICYLGNPHSSYGRDIENLESDESILLFYKFDALLKHLTDNFQAFGSRKALILFGMDFKEVIGTKMGQEEFEEFKAVGQTIINMLIPYAEQIFLSREVQKWLNKEFPSWYSDAIKANLKHFTLSKSVIEFWDGHRKAYRHTRGLAVRQAIFDNVRDIFNGKINVENIICSAEEELDIILNMNLEAMRNMTTVDGLVSPANYIRNAWDNFKPDYAKYLVLGYAYYMRKVYPDIFNKPYSPFSPESYVTSPSRNKLGEKSLVILGTMYPELIKEFPEFFENENKYRFFSKIEEKLPKSYIRLNDLLKSSFGIIIVENEGKKQIIIENLKTLYVFINTIFHENHSIPRNTLDFLPKLNGEGGNTSGLGENGEETEINEPITTRRKMVMETVREIELGSAGLKKSILVSKLKDRGMSNEEADTYIKLLKNEGKLFTKGTYEDDELIVII